MPRKLIKDYLSFSKNDRVAIVVIICIIGTTMVVPYFFKKNNSITVLTPELEIAVKKLDSFDSRKTKHFSIENNSGYPYYADRDVEKKYTVKGSLFNFDPNTLDADGFKKLGLRPTTIGTIMNYRNKGGKFRTAGDLQKIYGLHPDEFERLQPYITIAGRQQPSMQENEKSVENRQNYTGEKPAAYTIKFIDINKADTTAWIALPGIGSKLANRIVNFRNKLGGFHSIEQVAETYALPDSVFRKIKPRLILEPGITKININTADIELLKTHPYIRYNNARLIIAYRNANGPFKSTDALQNIMTLKQEDYIKMLPYLTVE